MEITLNISNVLLLEILGVRFLSEDDKTVIGDSRYAYVAKYRGKDHPLLPACSWHDRAYSRSWPGRNEGWKREEADAYWLNMMLCYSTIDYELQKEAVALYLFVRAHGEPWWEN